MTTLKFVPPRVRFVDPRTGEITREWYLFLQGLFFRAGGATGLSTTDVDAGSFAAMQPAAVGDACFADLLQAALVGGDTAGEAYQGAQGDAQAADLVQIDTTQPLLFWS